MTKTVHVAGKRKRAVARVTLKEGKGRIRINSQLLDTFEKGYVKDKIMEPVVLAGEIVKKIDFNINVKGGGWSSQAEASRLGIARGLVEWSGSKELKKKFLDYDRHLLIADVRRKEVTKPNDSGKARSKRQKSYR